MQDLESIQLSIASDGKKANLIYAPAGTTREDIYESLSKAGVVSGIDVDTIDWEVELSAGVEPLRDIVVAVATKTKASYLFMGQELPGEDEQLSDILWKLIHFRKDFEERGVINFPSWYVLADEEILSVKIDSPAISVRGDVIDESGISAPHFDNVSFSLIRNRESISLVSKREGYLYCSSEMQLSVYDPILISKDQMKMDFILVGGVLGLDKALARFENEYNASANRIKAVPAPDFNALKIKNIEKRVLIYPIRRGRPPIEGKPGYISLYSSDPDQAKPKSPVQFFDVYAITEFAEICDEIKPEDGFTVLDRTIPPSIVKGVNYSIGKNIHLKKDGSVTKLISAIDGVGRYDGENIDILSNLHIKGSVGPETGNIETRFDVYVEGDILSGYSVVSAGDIVINGSVENGSYLRSEKRLKIKKGLFGQDSRVYAKDEIEIFMAQESSLECGGDIIVEKFLYNVNLTCKGLLTVNGKGLSESDRTAIMGGKIVALAGIKTYSVGTYASKTELVVGVDYDAFLKLQKANCILPILVKKIEQLQNNAGVSLSDPHLKDKMKLLPQPLRLKVKETLNQLRPLISSYEELKRSIPILKEQSYPLEEHQLFIEVQKRAQPDVDIVLGRYHKIFREPLSGTRVIAYNGKVVALPL